MSWQEWIFNLSGIFFALSLIPSLFSEHKPSIWSSIPTAIFLFFIALAYYSLGYTVSAILTLPTVIEWGILAVQEFKLERE